MTNWLGRSLVAALALTVVQGLSGALLLRGVPSAPGALPWMMVGNLLVAGVMMGIARRLRGPVWSRTGVLFAVSFGIAANNLIEGLYFLSDVPIARLLSHSFLIWAAFALLLARWPGEASPALPAAGAGRSIPSWVARLVVCDLAYVVFYIVAGLAISPLIMEFYRSRPMPDPGFVLAMQLVLRGPVLIGVVLLVTRATGSGRAIGALGAGVVLSVLGGIAPLLIPNPWMPDAIRFAHLGEVGVSNFLYGLLVGWLLGASEAARAPVSGSSRPSLPPIAA
jgi:hypothetical protein